ncbi:ComF family protein [Allosphingosinicella sp.]|jgi:ComF family protein|uniref:ComF family protein n=1 Tax=Allosphingosinicella sp. TaxID=2823234 RepID=UPI002F05E623
MVVADAARSAVREIVDFALPPRCPGCGAIVGDEHSFCLECWSQLAFLGEPCCLRCGLPFEHGGGGPAECGACLADPPRFDRARAAVGYGEIPRKVALKLKYGGRPGVAETMARLMARHLEPGGGTILAPVPLHRWRIWKRGYNQAGLIASALARRSGEPASLDLLQRTRSTPYLRGMSPRERALAVRGAFRVAPKLKPLVAGRSVTLVDDVFTTGATANACALALRKAGASHVSLICWARVVRGEQGEAG